MVSGPSRVVGVSVGEADEILGPWTFAITAIGASFRRKQSKKKMNDTKNSKNRTHAHYSDNPARLALHSHDKRGCANPLLNARACGGMITP